MPDFLYDVCVPRQSVFDKSRRDVVLDLGSFLDGSLDEKSGESFFNENFVTAGMKTLVTKAFDRLNGARDQSATFLLSQAMGGGKTHNMIALGLLAKYPSLRHTLGPDFNLGTKPIRVIGFNGRESDYRLGLWGALAEQLGRKELFNDLYAPLRAPGETSWINLLRGEPTLILLDELPPYYDQARAVAIGASNLAEITTAALSNLLIAANRPELSNVVIVVSDLSGTAYDRGQQGIDIALDNLAKETQRAALRIEPVATTGDEIYDILRTRIFEKLPDFEVRDSVATKYAEAVRDAKQMDLTTQSPDSFAMELRQSYPFHFSLRDLYGRFKANPGFQQTRGLLRMMRAVVANLWSSGLAKSLYLIHPYNIDLNDADIFSEFLNINQSLSEAIRIDIANNGTSHAEELDKTLARPGPGTKPEGLAQDAAKLIYVASLANNPGAVLGLHDTEIIAWLCRPDRDIARIRADVLERLPTIAWYLHLSDDGRLYFKNVQNLAAKLHGMVSTYNRETTVKALRTYLETMFKPNLGDVYQDVSVLSSVDTLVLSPEKVILVITEPYVDATADNPLYPDWLQYYQNIDYKNRLIFLTGDRDTMNDTLKNAALYKAIDTIIAELEADHLSARDPQMTDAHSRKDKISLSLKSSIQQTFCQVVYPSGPKLRTEQIRFSFDGNSFDAENQIRETLLSVQKFCSEPANDAWVRKVEERLFDNQNPVLWSEVKKRAAVKTLWQFHPPRLLDEIKTYALHNGLWREEGNAIRHGPFPKDPPSVNVRKKSYDEKTGEATLEIIPVGGSKVLYNYGTEEPSKSWEEVHDYNGFRTDEVKVSFVCVDDNNREMPMGKPFTWTNTITVKGAIEQVGTEYFVRLEAVPKADIFYTTDGSDPLTFGVPYNGPFSLTDNMKIVQAFAEQDGVKSEVIVFNTKERHAQLNPEAPCVLKSSRLLLNQPTHQAWQLIHRMQQYKARAQGIALFVIKAEGDEEISYTLSEQENRTGEELEKTLNQLGSLIPNANILLSIQRLLFDKAQNFLDWKQQDNLIVDMATEVHQ
ncbi:MAG TPA: DUF499 domain-containing protein [Spirochaetales bacterium]|nr:DUF499 domain-containing protein [Spirochaetales bacterium]